MLKDITIGQYVKGDSILHRLDPRTKIFGMLAIMVALFFVNNWIGLVYAAVVVFAVLFASQVPLKFYIRGVKPLRWILLFTAAIQIFLTPGEIIWQWGILHITAEGVRLAIFMCVRLVLLVMTTSVLTLTTTPIVLTDAVENLLSPFKRIGVPAHELAMMMTIALRFIPLLADETEKIMAAQKARGAAFDEGGLMDRARALLPILVPLFLSAINRASELAMAMEARCYHGGEGRTRLHELHYENRDRVAGILVALILALAVASRWVIL
ncbi:MAG: energy-coupling factor transporter transmembrane component T [Peptococcaceae bacterium]|mgnify:FL=1|jgi:energy-coupling factor transport system permease protein|nr:energy-coupling factor transporter transmembrane component T [Peptococcaceae bacterium]MEE0207405.1 energy-coupling factor transporter transmembrane component T [Peptococcaceae bacterium]